MANYFVVLDRSVDESSDAAVNSVPTESTKILAPIESASVVKVEATTVAKAQEAARSAYPGRANVTPVVVTEAQWKES